MRHLINFKIATANGWKFLSNTNWYFSFRSDPGIVWIHGGLVTNLDAHNHHMIRVHNSEIESSNWILWNTITISSTQKFNTMKISVYIVHACPCNTTYNYCVPVTLLERWFWLGLTIVSMKFCCPIFKFGVVFILPLPRS